MKKQKNIQYKEVFTREGQIELKPHLFDLFYQCYNRVMTNDEWENLYIAPYFESALSVTAWDQEGLVGHYAIAPLPAMNRDGEQVLYGRGMTLAIAPRARAFGVLPRLMDLIRDLARQRGLKFILGFPNETSCRPLRLFCNWKSICESPLLKLPIHPEADRPPIETRAILPSDGLSPPYADTQYMKWRSSRKKFYIFLVRKRYVIVAKVYRDTNLDIMDAYSTHCPGSHNGKGQTAVDAVAKHLNCDTVCISQKHAEQLGLDQSNVKPDDYTVRLDVLPIDDWDTIPQIHFSLLFSDVY